MKISMLHCLKKCRSKVSRRFQTDKQKQSGDIHVMCHHLMQCVVLGIHVLAERKVCKILRLRIAFLLHKNIFSSICM